MTWTERLAAFFGRAAADTADEVPDGACPNCWGRYEYDGEVREVARDRQINVNNKAERHAFIQDFVVQHVDGIRLRNQMDGRRLCPRCGRSA